MNKVEILKKKLEDANWFITEIAKMLNIDTDGVGYDDIQLSLDDFQEAIKNLPNELKGVSNNEQKEKFCSYCGKRKTLKGNGTIEKLCEC